MLQIKFKQMVKSPALVISSFIFLLWFFVSNQAGLRTGTGDILLIPYPIKSVPVSFIFFLFFAYSFLAKSIRQQLTELSKVYWQGRMQEYIYSFILLEIPNILCYLFLVLCAVRNIWMSFGKLDIYTFFFALKCYVIHIFLVNTVAILFGILISFIRNEIKAFLTLGVVCCLFSTFTLGYLYSLTRANERMNHLVDVLALTTRKHDAMVDCDYLYAVGSVDLERVLFWCFLITTFLCYILIQRGKKIVVLSLSIVSFLILALYTQPHGSSYLDEANPMDAEKKEDYYYERNPEYIGVKRNDLTVENDFTIKKYKADISIKRVMKAKVMVYLNEKRDFYSFSLRHEYRVTSIIDEYGKKVSFKREGDWISFFDDNDKKSDFFTFYYEGASNQMYTNSQAIRLPAGYAYLPFPGKRYLYFHLTQEKDGYKNIIYGGSHVADKGHESEYDIRIDSPLHVYSNLTTKERNHFQGKSTGAFLVANPYLREKEIAGNRLIYSALKMSYRDGEAEQTWEQWRDYLQSNHITGKTIAVCNIITGNYSFYGNEGSDYMELAWPGQQLAVNVLE